MRVLFLAPLTLALIAGTAYAQTTTGTPPPAAGTSMVPITPTPTPMPTAPAPVAAPTPSAAPTSPSSTAPAPMPSAQSLKPPVIHHRLHSAARRIDKGSSSPDVNKAYMGGGMILEGPPGGPAPRPEPTLPGQTPRGMVQP